MLTQIQFYNLADYADPSKRTIVATQDGLTNETETNAWFAEVIAENPVPESLEAMVVTETSPWFVRQDDTNSLNGIDNIDKGNVQPKEEGHFKLLDFETVGPKALKIGEKLRLEAIDRERRLQEHMASFEG